jgi:hypothetical protein
MAAPMDPKIIILTIKLKKRPLRRGKQTKKKVLERQRFAKPSALPAASRHRGYF